MSFNQTHGIICITEGALCRMTSLNHGGENPTISIGSPLMGESYFSWFWTQPRALTPEGMGKLCTTGSPRPEYPGETEPPSSLTSIWDK